MRVSAAGNMPLQGLVKPPAKPVVMILRMQDMPSPADAYSERQEVRGRDRAWN